MKKSELMKATAALALCLAAVGCSHDKDVFDTHAKEKEYESKFNSGVLGGQDIDSRQTWNTTVATDVTVTSDEAGTVKVYTTSPMAANVAPLTTIRIGAGETKTIVVPRPQNVTQLYVARLDEAGFLVEQSLDITEQQSVAFRQTTAQHAAKHAVRRAGLNFDFPDAPAASDFPTEAPADAQPYSYGKTGSIVIENENGNVQPGENAVLYVKGNCRPDLNNAKIWTLYLPQGCTLYVLPGATLTLTDYNGTYSFAQSGVKVYVCPGGKLVSEVKFQMYNTALYNAGEVEVPELDVAGDGLVYNLGTLTVAGQAYGSNAGSALVNNGTLTASDLIVKGSSHFLNDEDGEVTISGKTDVNSTDATWVNRGLYTTGSFAYTAGSAYVINNCRLTVEEDMDIRLGQNDAATFYTDGSVITKTLVLDGPANVSMAANTLFKVTETATVNCSLADYGFHSVATGSDYAVLQAKAIQKGRENQRHEVTYDGQLIVDAESHFAQGHDGAGMEEGAFYTLKNGALMANGSTNVSYTIPKAKCNPGYSHGSVVPEPVRYFFYAFEDLGATGDFDFNDVVLGVTAPVNGTSDIYLMAAGGTLPVAIRLDGTIICDDVHAAFGESTDKMVNTFSKVDHEFVKIGTANNVSDPSTLPLSIVVKGASESHEVAAPAVGGTPLMIRVAGNDDGKWFWPTEYTNITKPYSGFGQWGANYSSSTDWYLHPVDAGVVHY